jgi:hypothetical protein
VLEIGGGEYDHTLIRFPQTSTAAAFISAKYACRCGYPERIRTILPTYRYRSCSGDSSVEGENDHLSADQSFLGFSQGIEMIPSRLPAAPAVRCKEMSGFRLFIDP